MQRGIQVTSTQSAENHASCQDTTDRNGKRVCWRWVLRLFFFKKYPLLFFSPFLKLKKKNRKKWFHRTVVCGVVFWMICQQMCGRLGHARAEAGATRTPRCVGIWKTGCFFCFVCLFLSQLYLSPVSFTSLRDYFISSPRTGWTNDGSDCLHPSAPRARGFFHWCRARSVGIQFGPFLVNIYRLLRRCSSTAHGGMARRVVCCRKCVFCATHRLLLFRVCFGEELSSEVREKVSTQANRSHARNVYNTFMEW